jgi:hypothetical protein
MAEQIKLTVEELNLIEDIKKRNILIKEEFGNIYTQKLNLKKREKRAKEFFNSLIESEVHLAKSLEEKYGKGTVNTDTGEFTKLS